MLSCLDYAVLSQLVGELRRRCTSVDYLKNLRILAECSHNAYLNEQDVFARYRIVGIFGGVNFRGFRG